jgi:hypothetical protein
MGLQVRRVTRYGKAITRQSHYGASRWFSPLEDKRFTKKKKKKKKLSNNNVPKRLIKDVLWRVVSTFLRPFSLNALESLSWKINFQNNELINCREESLSWKLKFFQLRNSLSFIKPASWLLCSHDPHPVAVQCSPNLTPSLFMIHYFHLLPYFRNVYRFFT